MASTQRLLDPDTIAMRAGQEPSFLRLPEPATLFGERAMRLRQLATGHAMGDYLCFAAEVCLAQHETVRSTEPPAPPPPETFEHAARLGVAPLPTALWLHGGAWRTTLRALLQHLAPHLPDDLSHSTVQRLLDTPDSALDPLATRLLHDHLDADTLAAAPFIAAALQVHGARLVAAAAQAYAALPAGAFGRVDDLRTCPCCGSRPTASVQRLGAEASGQRYLHCSMCAAQWHLVRITCAHCGNHQGLTYEQLQPVDAIDTPRAATVRAECCPACRGYLKQVAQDQDPHAEAVADDVASVALDLLLGDTGWQRLGVNTFLLFGDGEPAADGLDDPSPSPPPP